MRRRLPCSCRSFNDLLDSKDSSNSWTSNQQRSSCHAIQPIQGWLHHIGTVDLHLYFQHNCSLKYVWFGQLSTKRTSKPCWLCWLTWSSKRILWVVELWNSIHHPQKLVRLESPWKIESKPKPPWKSVVNMKINDKNTMNLLQNLSTETTPFIRSAAAGGAFSGPAVSQRHADHWAPTSSARNRALPWLVGVAGLSFGRRWSRCRDFAGKKTDFLGFYSI